MVEGRIGVAEVQLEGFTDVSAMLQSGIYALVRHGEVVYVGQSKVMLARVCNHRTAWGRRKLTGKARGVVFDSIWVMPVHVDRLNEVEYDMIQRYRPKLNRIWNGGPPPEIAALIGHLVSIAPRAQEPRIRRRI